MRKVIVVSGCNGGMGKATCNALLDDFEIYGLDLADEPAIENDHFHYLKSDLTDKESLNQCLEQIKENKIFAIVNAAGIFVMESIIEGDESHLRKVIEVNFWGAYNLNRALFNKLEKGSRIILISSEVARYSPQPFMGYYTGSKHLIDCYADVLRRECGYLGIYVSKIQSGAISTGLLGGVNEKYDELIASTNRFKSPLTKFKYLMSGEIKKKRSPDIIGKLVRKIIMAKKPKARYRKKNSKALRFLNLMPESWQDNIYWRAIK